MIAITRVNEITNRFIKLLRFGKSDSRTADQFAPYGIDSKPIKDLVALYSPTQNDGELACIGYISRSELTKSGEIRVFST